MISNDHYSTLIQFPPGAVTAITAVTYTYQNPTPTGQLIGIKHFFELEASRNGSPVTTFLKPVTITVKYTDQERGVATPASLKLYWWTGSSWTTTGIALIARNSNVITATTTHFTRFAVLGETNRLYLPAILK